MKDGVLTVNNKEYVFHKASGEYEWWILPEQQKVKYKGHLLPARCKERFCIYITTEY